MRSSRDPRHWWALLLSQASRWAVPQVHPLVVGKNDTNDDDTANDRNDANDAKMQKGLRNPHFAIHLPPMPRFERVVVTGMGLASPLGSSVSEFWDGLVAGRGGVVALTSDAFAKLSTRIGALVPDLEAHWDFGLK